MPMILKAHVDLPEHPDGEGFDHAAYSTSRSVMYVAHTANDCADMIDCKTDRFIGSIGDLTGVAGALVNDERGLLFTSNRGEDTVGIANLDGDLNLRKVPVGSHPNGLAFDPKRQILFAANVGESPVLKSHTITVVDAIKGQAVAEIPVPGRTRWTVYDADRDLVYVNIREPACIVVIECGDPTRIARTLSVSGRGPHGLDLDPIRGLLYCACDDATLLTIDIATGKMLHTLPLSGAPDVIFLNAAKRQLYVASGDPGAIDVIDVDKMSMIETLKTGLGAHTIGFDPMRNKVYAFLPETHQAAVFEDA